MRYALLFAGQGSQHAQMLPWLEGEAEAAGLMAQLGATLGAGWREHLQDAAWMHRNRVAQPLIVGTALAAWQGLQSRMGVAPVAVAGYSVGELAAYAAAGVFPAHTALQLAAERAALMDAAVEPGTTGLLSIAGAPEPEILARCPSLAVAIRIRADHALYAGTTADLDAATRALGEHVTCKPIAVTLASHSPWMATAALGFAEVLRDVAFARARTPVATDADGATRVDPQRLRTALARQVDHTVEWGACLAAVAERRPNCVLEIGPGNALARMWAEARPDIPVRSIEDFRDAAGAAAWLARQA